MGFLNKIGNIKKTKKTFIMLFEQTLSKMFKPFVSFCF